MNLQSLRTFLCIVERGSFTAAAEAVGCSPSAVSLQVKQLETYFGRPLFDRSTRSMAPTPFALELAQAAGDFSRRIGVLRATPAMKIQGRIRLGVITSMQSDVLPPVLRRIRDQYPDLEVFVPPLNDTDELLAALKAARLDLALVVRPVSGGSRRLAWRTVGQQPYVMLVPNSAPLATPGELLKRYGWVSYDTALTGGRMASKYVRALHPGIQCAVELRSMDAIVSMVSAGLGVAVVPRPRAPIVQAYGLREVPLGDNAPCRTLSLVWQKVDNESRTLQAVGDVFAAIYDER